MPTYYTRDDRRTYIVLGENTLEAKRLVDSARQIVTDATEQVAQASNLVADAAGDVIEARDNALTAIATGTAEGRDSALASIATTATAARDDALAAIATEGGAAISQSRAWAESDVAPDGASGQSAKTWAANSGLSADRSDTNADRSELAASVAAAGANLFASVSAGLAATPNGQTFSVQGDDGNTFATTYRNVAGAATLIDRLPNKALFDGIAPAVNTRVLALSRYAGVTPNAPTTDCRIGIQAAMAEAQSAGKVLDIGNADYHVLSSWTTQTIAQRLEMRGDGGRLIGTAVGTTNMFNMQAPVFVDGVNFTKWGNLFYCGTNFDLSGYDLVFRNIEAMETYALVFNTRENFRIRRLLLDNVAVLAELEAGTGYGRGQGIRWQANGFREVLANGLFVKGKNYQGVRLGGYPHGLIENRRISVTNTTIEDVCSSGQSNGLQIFGDDFFIDNVFVRNITATNSSNVEPVYVVGTYGSIGNITVENAGQEQGAVAIKSHETKQHGPISIRTKIHKGMGAAIRIDGENTQLDGVDIQWLWEEAMSTTGTGAAYTATGTYVDASYNANNALFFIPHTINTSTTPTLNVNGLGAKVMRSDAYPDAAIELGQIRPGAVYRAEYDKTRDVFRIWAVRYRDNVSVATVTSGAIYLPNQTLADGAVYWLTTRESVGGSGGCNMSVGGSALMPIKRMSGGVLSTYTSTISNGFARAFYYSAADACFIRLEASGSNGDTGSFVLAPPASSDAYQILYPDMGDLKDGVLIIFPATNAIAGVTVNVDGTARPVLRSNGSALAVGELEAGLIYRLRLSGGNWLRTPVGKQWSAVDCLASREGYLSIRNFRMLNVQYGIAIEFSFNGRAELRDVYVEGKSKLDAVVRFDTNPLNSVQTLNYALVSNLNVERFYNSIDNIIQYLDGVGVKHVEDVRVMSRGTHPFTSGTLISLYSSLAAGSDGTLRIRNAPFQADLKYNIRYPEVLARLDTEHWTAVANNPASVAAGGYNASVAVVTHPGARAGDFVQVTHSQNSTGLRFDGYVSANDTITVTASNPTGAAIDLGSGTLSVRALKAG